MPLLSRYDGNYYTPSSVDSTGFTPFLGTDPRDLGLYDWQAAANYIEARFGPSAIGYAGMHGYFDHYFSSTYNAAAQSSLGQQVASGQAARDDATGGFKQLVSNVVQAVAAAPAFHVGGATAAAAVTGNDVKAAAELDLKVLSSVASPLVAATVSSYVAPAAASVGSTLGLTGTSWSLPSLPFSSSPLAGLLPIALTGSVPINGGSMDLRDILRQAISPLLSSTGGAVDTTQQLLAQFLPTNTTAAAAPSLSLPSIALGSLPAIGGSVMRAGSAAVGVIRSVGGRILGVMLPSGMRVSRKAAVQLAKSMGITAAATALGIGAADLAEMVLQDAGKRGRGRGVTGAQLRITRRTMRTVERMHRQIAGYCRSAGVQTTRYRYLPAPRGRR